MTVRAGELKGIRDRNALAAFNHYNNFIDTMLKKRAELRQKLIVECFIGSSYGGPYDSSDGYELSRETAEMLCSEYGRNGWHTSIKPDPDHRDSLLILTIKEIE